MISFVICSRYGGRYRDDRHRGYEDRNKPATEYGSRGYYEFFYWWLLYLCLVTFTCYAAKEHKLFLLCKWKTNKQYMNSFQNCCRIDPSTVWLEPGSENPSTQLEKNALKYQQSCKGWKLFVENYQGYSSMLQTFVLWGPIIEVFKI